MKELAVRLTAGMDLKQSICTIAEKNNIQAGVILSAVGCLSRIHLRLATAQYELEKENHYEIVSLSGTIASNGVHLHISASDQNAQTIGGHLLDGCIVNTTCELVIGILEEYSFYREFDPATGYRELTVKTIDESA